MDRNLKNGIQKSYKEGSKKQQKEMEIIINNCEHCGHKPVKLENNRRFLICKMCSFFVVVLNAIH
jgi:hypothetical protein